MKIKEVGMGSVDVTLTSQACELLKEICLNAMSGDPEFENEDFVLIMMAGLFETASDMADLRLTYPLFMDPTVKIAPERPPVKTTGAEMPG